MSLFGFGQGITLKELLENPNLQHPPEQNKDGVGKEKGGNFAGGYDFSSAFLGPNLWNTPTDDENFKLEYMDLDEFLSENGIPGIADDSNSSSVEHVQNKDSPVHPNLGSTSPASSYTSESAAIPPSEIFDVAKGPASPNDSLDYTSSSDLQSDGISIEGVTVDDQKSETTTAECPGVKSKVWPSVLVECVAGSVSPPRVQVDFKVSEQELALASIPGQEGFDPVKRRFTDEELKPQPIIKKSKKIFVPEDLKDPKYWTRRKKNNVAAKRSRDARRVKENQIAMRASFLESENETMKQELLLLKRENTSLRNSLSKYEGKQ